MFTMNQIQEIHSKLQAMAKKDSQFRDTESIVTEDTYIPLIQNGENRKIFQKDLLDDTYDYIFPDIENMADELNAKIDSQSVVLEALKESVEKGFTDTASSFANLDKYLKDYLASSQNYLDIIGQALSAIENHLKGTVTLTVTSNPGAVVSIDGVETDTKEVVTGTNVYIEIKGVGYEPFRDIVAVHKTQNLHIPLKGAPVICSLTVTAIPKNAVIKIDGVERSSIQVSSNTEVHVQVEAEGYNTYDQMILVTDPEQKLEVTLVKEKEIYTDIDIKVPESLDLGNIPQEGKDIQLTAVATVILPDKTETTRDVTNIATWNIVDTNNQGGSLNKGNGLFTILPNTGRNKDSYEIEVSINSEANMRLYKRVTL